MFFKFIQVFIWQTCFLVSAIWRALHGTLVHKHEQDFISLFRSATSTITIQCDKFGYCGSFLRIVQHRGGELKVPPESRDTKIRESFLEEEMSELSIKG